MSEIPIFFIDILKFIYSQPQGITRGALEKELLYTFQISEALGLIQELEKSKFILSYSLPATSSEMCEVTNEGLLLLEKNCDEILEIDQNIHKLLKFTSQNYPIINVNSRFPAYTFSIANKDFKILVNRENKVLQFFRRNGGSVQSVEIKYPLKDLAHTKTAFDYFKYFLRGYRLKKYVPFPHPSKVEVNISQDYEFPLVMDSDHYHFSGKFISDQYNLESGFYINGASWGHLHIRRDYNHLLKSYTKVQNSFIEKNILNGYSLHNDPENISFIVRDKNLEIERSGEYRGQYFKHELFLTPEDLDITSILHSNPDVLQKMEEIKPHVLDIEYLYDIMGEIFESKGKAEKVRAQKFVWAYHRNSMMEKNEYTNDSDIVPYYIIQQGLQKKINQEPLPLDVVRYVAGADVAYNELEQVMVGAIVVLDMKTFEVIDTAVEVMNITFPYIPGLFSFREVPPLVKALEKLSVRPDLIVCDGHGIAHPKGIGMASHLGVVSDIPTIGCAKSKLIGNIALQELGPNKGNFVPITYNSEIIGAALRTRDHVKPMFVSIGHKIDLPTAIQVILHLCKEFRIPETTRQADQLVNSILKVKTTYRFSPDG